MNYEIYARLNYEAYRAEFKRQYPDIGDLFPCFDVADEGLRQAWIAGTKAVIEAVL